MKAVIIEDELQAIMALKQEVETNCPELLLCGTASNVEDAYALIMKERPELIFLDIQLKKGNGFDLLSKLDNYGFKVIFTTAYSQYALQAIKISALDYLLKPVDSEELIKAVAKAMNSSQDHMQLQLKSFIQNQNLNPLLKKIALQTSKGIYLYELESLVRLEANGNYTSIYLKDEKKLTVAKTMRDFEEMLHSLGFVRIHHSHIINLRYLQSYINKDGGYVIMDNRTTLPVSKRKRTELLSLLQNLHKTKEI
ncbi:MAG: LytTR family DNA-binding domain-containing protein [Flavobacteriaceae bacterium]